ILNLAIEGSFVAPHLHISLQHTQPEILKLMGRDDGEGIIEKRWGATGKNFRLALGADIIVGFPGESDAVFEKLYNDLENLPFAYLHIFPFSPRPGTLAAQMKPLVPSQVIKMRVNRLRRLGEEKRRRFIEKQLGTEVEAIIESSPPSSLLAYAVSDNYIRLLVPVDNREVGKSAQLRIERRGERIWGIPLDHL
ncbi:MAG: hypothetical protein ACK4OO_04805, partial [bacterium]